MVMPLCGEQETTFGVCNGKWVTIDFIAHQKLSFIVRTPNLIALLWVEHREYRFDPLTPFLRFDQAMSRKNIVNSDDTWNVFSITNVKQQFPDFFSSPERMFFL